MIAARLIALLAALIFSAVAASEESPTFESCTDAHGQRVPVQADTSQAVLVRTDFTGPRPAIRYNPEILPDLPIKVRLFFYAHQCARVGLGGPTDTLAAARQADCIGLNTLLDSGALRYGTLPALQAGLEFSEEEWRLLPGPRRSFDLSQCPRETRGRLRLPPGDAPTATQAEWDTCVRQCADSLWTCQKACGSKGCASCQEGYERCRAGCGEAPSIRPLR